MFTLFSYTVTANTLFKIILIYAYDVKSTHSGISNLNCRSSINIRVIKFLKISLESNLKLYYSVSSPY